MKNVIPIMLAVLLAGCGGAAEVRPEPIVVPQPVAVAVTQACVPDTLKDAPAYVDSDKELWKPGNDAADRYQLVLAGRAQRTARLNELEPIVAGCPRGRSTK